MTTHTASPDHARVPLAPLTVEETGLSQDVLEQLVLKVLHMSGEQTASSLSRRLGLLHSVLEPILQHLKHSYLCDVRGGASLGGPSYVYRITDAGRARAMLALEQSQYVGTAPVPFAQYADYMHAFMARAARTVTRETVDRAFEHLVLSRRVLDQLGPAVNGGHSLFVYGPPGNGKTVISQGIARLLTGEVAIPQAIDFEGHLVQVFDPAVHVPIAISPDEPLDRGAPATDARWIRCARPLVMVGGELTLQSLELAFNSGSRLYQAPIQLLANGGVLVIDDFGRQRCSVVDLLNRWILPLESRTDYLTVQSGQKMPVPFAVLVVFATNIKPTDLVDEAFLRRIHYKVFAENPTALDFARIFERCCHERGLPYDALLVDRLIAEFFRRRGIALRGCHPRDLIDHALAIADYLGAPRVLTYERLLDACTSYFLDEQAAGGPA
ncbi:MAG: ATP-binding protein [Vicinamibacterales bacterium]